MRRLLSLRGLARIAVLAVGLYAIVTWQRGFYDPATTIDGRFKLTAASGINRDADFVFYLHHLGLFPIATDAPIKADTADEAKRLLREEPSKLKQDQGSTFRAGGDRGRIYLYLVDVALGGSSIKPTLKPALAILFTGSLCFLFTAFWAIRRSVLGFVLAVFLGSNPFQLFEVYRHENVFSIAITTMIVLLAINVPLMEKKLQSTRYPIIAALMSGAVIGIIRTIRGEAAPMMGAVLLVYLTIQGLRWLPKARIVVALVIGYAVTSFCVVHYLDAKLANSKQVMATVGGSVYTGPVTHYHIFWHPIFCGLGDFDTKYGYEWQDNVAYRYALPILKAQHPENPRYARLEPHAVQPFAYDTAGKYPIMFEETPGYGEIIREKVVKDIKADKRWYWEIIKKRIWRTLEENTPATVAYKDSHWDISGSLLGLLCVPLALLLIVKRRWFFLKLLLFPLPLGIPAIIMYSGGGMNWYNCFHIFGIVIIGAAAAEGFRAATRKRLPWLPRRA